MQNFYFRSIMLVFIMIGAFTFSGCSMYPAITPVVQPTSGDEHNIAKSDVEDNGKIQLILNNLFGKNESVIVKKEQEIIVEKGEHLPTELIVDFEAQPIETIVEEPIPKNEAGETDVDTTPSTPVVSKEVKEIALTFDDGPDLNYTPQVLDILKGKKIKATFFIVGIQIKKFPEVVQRMVDEGHLIANHTYHHPNLKTLTKDEILLELDSTDELIEEIVGFRPTIVRPPYGSINKEVRQIIEDSGREVVLWNIDPRDWASTPVDEMYENVMTNARNEGNILFHSFGGKQIQNTVDLLPRIIDALLEESYTFVTADELIKEDE